MSSPSPVRTQITNGIAWVTVDNPPVNATSTAVRRGLEEAVAQAQGARLAVLMCAGKTFIAGGDMSEFDRPPEPPHLPDVVNAIEASRTPFIAAMQGKVLGGGFEIAMACAWRIALPGTRFGLPEVNVGLIPGAGGSQRAPRLLGMETAIEMACLGKTFTAEALAESGAIDAVVSDDLRQAVEAFIADLPPRPVPVSQRTARMPSPEALSAARERIEKRARGQQSPLHNFEALQWAALPFAEGQAKERALHLKLRLSDESRALRHAFFAERAVARPAAIAGATPREVRKVAVAGGGLMGAGIATACLGAGLEVALIERDEEAAQAARERVERLLDGALGRGRISPAERESQLAALHVSADHADAAGADLAIEAVFEDLDAKRAVFARLAEVLDDTAILATNTSYLNPEEIFSGLPAPGRCLGLHFFSPAHVMKLVEVVRLPATGAEVLSTAFALARRLGKVPVLSGICDGFIGNRMLAAYRREAEYLLADGALPHQIDAAMRGFGYAMGPFEMQDMAGLQIAWANRKRQAATRDPGERYETISDMLCEMGRLGQRSGRGWYRYEEGSRTPLRDPEVEALIEEYSGKRGIARREFSAEDITARLIAVLVNEGARIVEEGIAAGFDEVDMVQIHGYGFPRWRGGPMHHARTLGWKEISRTMRQVAGESPGSWPLAEIVSSN